METIYIVIGLFSFAALLGIILISYVLRSKKTPLVIAFIHGPVAATALGVLIYYSIVRERMLTASIVLFALAAVFGIVLIVKDLSDKEKPLPKGLAITHGLIAVIAFVVLLVNVFS
jgi:hypothetical protein